MRHRNLSFPSVSGSQAIHCPVSNVYGMVRKLVKGNGRGIEIMELSIVQRAKAVYKTKDEFPKIKNTADHRIHGGFPGAFGISRV
jgi:hypothetical protein